MANNWFVIPELVSYVLFGLAGFLAVVKFFAFLSVGKKCY